MKAAHRVSKKKDIPVINSTAANILSRQLNNLYATTVFSGQASVLPFQVCLPVLNVNTTATPPTSCSLKIRFV